MTTIMEETCLAPSVEGRLTSGTRDTIAPSRNTGVACFVGFPLLFFSWFASCSGLQLVRNRSVIAQAVV